MKKVLFISSMGGHLTELMQLNDLFTKYETCLVTEKNKSTENIKSRFPNKVYYLKNITKDHMIKYMLLAPLNIIKSIYILFKFNPSIIISTGAHTCVPMCIVGKIFRKKIIYIESFANIGTKSLTGRIIYPIADVFIVQWKSLQKIYPKAKYEGWLF